MTKSTKTYSNKCDKHEVNIDFSITITKQLCFKTYNRNLSYEKSFFK